MSYAAVTAADCPARPPWVLFFREGEVSTKSILVVDDEDAIRVGVRLTLEDAGYTVLEAANGYEALELLRSSAAPLVVLLDLMMPEMSGLRFLQALKDEPKLAENHAFVIFSAARSFTAPTLVVYLPGKRLLDLPKPFSLDDLLAVVEQAACEIGAQSTVT